MFLPNNHHFLNWGVLRLRQEKVHGNCHHHDPESEEEEETEFEVAEDGWEDLSDVERDDHVDRHVDALSSQSDFCREAN